MSIQRFEAGPRMSQCVVHGDTVYTAGQVAQGARGASVAEQTKDILAAIDKLLHAAGTDKSKLLTANIWLADMASFEEMNQVWDAWVAPRRHAGAGHGPGAARPPGLQDRDHGHGGARLRRLPMHVVVMGAGVVGVTTAWQLLEDGHEVTVIDRQPEAACETSFANAGLVAVGHALAWANPRALRTLIRSLIKARAAAALPLAGRPGVLAFLARVPAPVHRGARPRQQPDQAPPVRLRPAGAAAGSGRDRGRVRRHAGRHSLPAPHAGDPGARHRQSAHSRRRRAADGGGRPASARPQSIRRSRRPRTGSPARSTARPTRAAMPRSSRARSLRSARRAARASGTAPRSRGSRSRATASSAW